MAWYAPSLSVGLLIYLKKTLPLFKARPNRYILTNGKHPWTLLSPARVQPLYGAGRKESSGTGLGGFSRYAKNCEHCVAWVERSIGVVRDTGICWPTLAPYKVQSPAQTASKSLYITKLQLKLTIFSQWTPDLTILFACPRSFFCQFPESAAPHLGVALSPTLLGWIKSWVKNCCDNWDDF